MINGKIKGVVEKVMVMVRANINVENAVNHFTKQVNSTCNIIYNIDIGEPYA